MNTDDLRDEYGKSVSFNCEKGDEAFTDDYVLWLEKQLLIQRVVFNEAIINKERILYEPRPLYKDYKIEVKSEVELANKCKVCGRTDEERLTMTSMCGVSACPY